MNEELKNTLITVTIDMLQGASEAMKGGAALIKQEIPKVIEEYIKWAIYSSILQIIGMSVLLVMAGYLMIKKIPIWIKEVNGPNDEEYKIVFVIIGLLFSGVTLILYPFSLYSSAETALKAYVSPRVYLIDKALEISKKQGQ